MVGDGQIDVSASGDVDGFRALQATAFDPDLMRVLKRLLARSPGAVCVVMTPHGDTASPVESTVLQDWRRGVAESPPVLTRRQTQVLQAMAEGVTEREIARRLGISERTVQLHVANLCRAVGARSQFQMGLAAARIGLI